MDGNPYSAIVAMMRREGAEQSNTGETANTGLGAMPIKMRLGTVLQKSPLQVEVAGVPMPAPVLRINERLTKGAKCKVNVTGALSGSISCSGYGSPRLSGGALSNAVMEQMEIDLEKGDEVLLLTGDDQIFYIVMKVVAAV